MQCEIDNNTWFCKLTYTISFLFLQYNTSQNPEPSDYVMEPKYYEFQPSCNKPKLGFYMQWYQFSALLSSFYDLL